MDDKELKARRDEIGEIDERLSKVAKSLKVFGDERNVLADKLKYEQEKLLSDRGLEAAREGRCFRSKLGAKESEQGNSRNHIYTMLAEDADGKSVVRYQVYYVIRADHWVMDISRIAATHFYIDTLEEIDPSEWRAIYEEATEHNWAKLFPLDQEE